ncbi:hypothetical protein HH682_05820 [Rosenbergiella sp. S61]|uniref:Uncharacterized protein n=1 Tax=Rosenbergiella gaditana TaxID=2726987 RepID=A0ABS5SXH8_9GAMM|nr:hypothetical protein [Rosenbergiella gaditana]MBT0723962.1 hypothetical protein [Rosenbergiella gaditana]
MITLTKEQREELTKFARSALNSLNGIEPENPNQYDDCLSEYMQKLVEIALESLTVDHFGYGISEPDGAIYLSECCIDKYGSTVSDEVTALNDGVTDLEGGYKVVQLFTAPPVPEIKLPPEFNENHDSFNEFRRGWNGAISEVKRTNGLGE